jgi:hypothetical protein
LHEIAPELESPFSDVVGIVRVKVHVAATGGDVINVAFLKRNVRSSA